MSFLAPLFLTGALALALPVMFHLMRRTTRRRADFSSLMFLRATPPRLTRRNRIEDLLLLLLRCAAIGLLAVGFARPWIRSVLPEAPVAEPPKCIAILLDTSASMRRGNLWSDAQRRAEAVLRRVSPQDRVGLFTFDRQFTPLVTYDEWDATAPADRVPLARSRLAPIRPGWSATRLDQALVRASELVEEREGDRTLRRRQVVVISDFQQGSQLGALQGQEWPRGIEFLTERLAAATANAGLHLLSEAGEAPAPPGTLRVRVTNQPDSRREQFQVGWVRVDGPFAANPTLAYVPAGQSRILALPPPNPNSGADRIILRGDDEPFDNTVFATPLETSPASVVYIGEDQAHSRGPLYFVRRALHGTPRQPIQITATQPGEPALPIEAAAANLFIVTAAMPRALAAALNRHAAQGKTVLFAPASAAAARSLGDLLGQGSVAVDEGTPRNYVMLGQMDFRHPLFAPFADPRYSDFTKIHFWKYRHLDLHSVPGAHVLASFDNGDPAIVDVAVGKGRVVFFASGWQPADSQLALSSKFVPLLGSALELSGGVSPAPAPFLVGDSVPLPAKWLPHDGAAAVTLPDGSRMKLALGETNFTHASMPGIYQVTSGTNETRFAVNLSPAESRTSALPVDQLESIGVPVGGAPTEGARVAQHRVLLQTAELENHQKLWRWFVLATLGLLLVETAVAGRRARCQVQREGVAG